MTGYSQPLPRTLLAALALLLLTAPWWSEPVQALLEQPQMFPLSLHTVMESFAILVSILIFSVSWNTYSAEQPRTIIIIACGFLCVGLIDFAHMLSYKGMPDFVTPASPQKAVVFWLGARYLNALTLLLVALLPWRPFTSPRMHYLLLGCSLIIVSGIYAVELGMDVKLPRLFVDGEGPTSLKIILEFALSLVLMATAWLFYRKAERNPDINAHLILCAILITILSEICFTLYQNLNDIYSLLGHVYKVIAYWFIYRAIFVTSVKQPYERLQAEIAERLRAEATADYLVHHDPLTGLPNRHLLESRLEQTLAQALSNGRQCAVAFVNLDNFQAVNDSLGLASGDEVLKLVALRLSQTIRDNDTLARYGNDDFVLVLADMADDTEVMPVLQKVLDIVQEPCLVGGHEITMTVSIGLALAPGDGTRSEQLLMNADTAMHRAKQNGGNTYRFFEEAMNVTATEYLTLRNGIKKGLSRDEFVLFYQPQIDLVSGRIIGAEALVRWQHPERGLVPPAQFIPIAEESGLILPLSNWILDSACSQAVGWLRSGLQPIRIAVNLSALQFTRDCLFERVRGTLAQSGLPPHLLELELTESLLMQDHVSISETLRQLKELGVRIAIDDFGTGYSSLSYLKRFAVDVLKIDQSFTRGIVDSDDDLAIVNAIIQMAHSLGLNTLAEGIETEEIRKRLEQYGCNDGQGYLFARPMPAHEFAEFLRHQQAAVA